MNAVLKMTILRAISAAGSRVTMIVSKTSERWDGRGRERERKKENKSGLDCEELKMEYKYI